MSNINLIIIKQRKISFTQTHYHNLLKLLNTNIEKITQNQTSHYLDAGYMILDFNKKMLLSSQCAFSLRHLKTIGKKNLRHWVFNWF